MGQHLVGPVGRVEGAGGEPGGLRAQVVVQDVQRLADAAEMAVDGLVEEGHQEQPASPGLVDPFERESLRDWDEVGIMPKKEED